MTTAMEANKRTPKSKWLGLGLVVLLSLAVLGYYALIQQKDRTVNHDYYRILYEASNTFKENLDKLDRMHQYNENVSSIRSLMPSYTRKEVADSKSETLRYILDGSNLQILHPKFHAQLAFEDILPTPKKGFSQFLFADKDGNVLATIGGERTISIVDLSSINHQIQKKNKQFQLNFSDPNLDDDSSSRSSLPTYSNHVDMKISYGDFRVYVFPFSLATPLEQNSKTTSKLERLYLVGLLPQQKITEQSSSHWNLSILVVTVVSILFMWTMLRLYLLPKNQSISRTYRIVTIVASYGFFIVILSLLLAHFQKQVQQDNKDLAANQYANSLSRSLTEDLNDVFNDLSDYGDFYASLTLELEKLAQARRKFLGESDPQNEQASWLSTFTPEQIAQFNQALRLSLARLAKNDCALSNKQMPGSASSGQKLYNIRYHCSAADERGMVDFELPYDAIVTLVSSYMANKKDLDIIDFYSAAQQVNLISGTSLETSISPDMAQNVDSKLLSVFALNTEGNSVVPSIIFQESNALPVTFNLSHRNYYKLVRDQKGWDLALDEYSQSPYENVYIQRLLNVNNGTRGTTISMPLSSSSHSDLNLTKLDYVLAADVLLPTMTLGKSPPKDFSYMVIDRLSGDVLFHNDTARSLVENLYFSSESGSTLSYWLKAGLDRSSAGQRGAIKTSPSQIKIIEGHYHGQSGRFAITPTAVPSWAMVVFYPDDSLQSFMITQFLYLCISMSMLLAFLIVCLFGIRYFVRPHRLKRKLALPAKLNIRLVMLVSSVLVATSSGLVILGNNIDSLGTQPGDWQWSVWLPILGLCVCIGFVYRGCYHWFVSPAYDVQSDTQLQAKRGSKRLITAVMIFVGVHFWYLQETANAPVNRLEYYYNQLSCNWLAHEKRELTNIGLSRYPNSITKNRIKPYRLLPVAPDWINQLNDVSGRCEPYASVVDPDEYPTLSSLIGANHTWQWINIYLMARNGITSISPLDSFQQFIPWQKVLLYGTVLALFIWAWFRFNTRILWNRLYCPERFLQHVERLTQSVHQLAFEKRSEELIIQCDTVKLNGIGIALLLRHLAEEDHSTEQLEQTLPGFPQLAQLSPCIRKFAKQNVALPNLKIHIKQYDRCKKLSVQLWDIETCLESTELRKHLLDLLMELKSLTLSGQIRSFTLFTGFHSLQRVKLKDPLSLEQGPRLEQAEYLSWAECLMDFVVKVPESFKQGIDWQLLANEVRHFPELAFLQEQIPKQEADDSWSQVFKHHEAEDKHSRLTTLNYILLNAEALYRFKWESCSSAEKLALYHLAKGKRLNPTNTQMIEHLALNGLIRVREGHLDIVNHSFAQFVCQAESASTLKNLISHGEAGLWKSYRLPLGVLILVIIGGIAMTSGESIYIVAASIAGVLGTIASVTNSANLLRSHSQD